MSCHGCARGFGFLTKEYGCTKCGFAFCSKCLVDKVQCKSCSLRTTAATRTIPPVMLQDKLEKLENPNRNPVVVYTENPKMADLKRGLSVEDQELVNRLSKLKSDIREMKSVPTQEEIEERLAKLKDIDPQVYRKPVVFSKPKTGVDEATDLINQMREEVSIDRQSDLPPYTPDQQSTHDPNEDVEMLLQNEALAIQADAKMALEGLAKDKEIQERLRKLRIDRETKSKPIKEAEDATEMDSEDEEKHVSMIIERAMAENRLELDEDEGIIAGATANEDELPWCELCNEDAQLRCLGCDRELYCRRCWKETHRDSDMKRHQIEDYKAPK